MRETQLAAHLNELRTQYIDGSIAYKWMILCESIPDWTWDAVIAVDMSVNCAYETIKNMTLCDREDYEHVLSDDIRGRYNKN